MNLPLYEFENSNLQIIAWDLEGKHVATALLQRKTTSLAGLVDCDISVPELGASQVFVTLRSDKATLIFQSSDSSERTFNLQLGMPIQVGGLNWVLTRATLDIANVNGVNSVTADESQPPYGRMIQDVISWLARPMSGPDELRMGLKVFLENVTRDCSAAGGMLVVAAQGEFSLAGCHGIQPEEAQRLWEKVPQSLIADILREKAKIILPDGFQKRPDGTSTIYLKGVRSLAGFPVIAEGRILAIFFLTFDSLMRRMTAEMQAAVEAAADLLGLVIQRAMLREEISALRMISTANSAGDMLPADRLMIGESRAITLVYKMLRRLATVDVSTLITGETGTGKELAARELHRMSVRRNKPFIVVNAAALPENLVESELFGHRRGAFTGALSDRCGLIEQAHEGSLFIDEIGELPLAAQAKLLRALQERTVVRVGDATERPVDFRMIAATHRNLETMVKEGTFREDLYYRIAGAIIHLPPLRERREDIVQLANHFRKAFASRNNLTDKQWSADALHYLETAEWNGNIRELENTVGRAFVMAEGSVIRRCDIIGNYNDDANTGIETLKSLPNGVSTSPFESLTDAREHWTRNFIIEALRRHHGKRSDTAKALGIGERTLFRYIEQYGIKDV